MEKEKEVKIHEPELSNIRTDMIGGGSVIHSHVWIGDKVIIGRNVKIQAFAYIPNGVTICDDAFIGPGVIFTNDAKLKTSGPEHWEYTYVGKGAKIGAGAMIRAGVAIRDNAIVGMGAVVLEDVPSGATVVGNPAKVIDNNTKE